MLDELPVTCTYNCHRLREESQARKLQRNQDADHPEDGQACAPNARNATLRPSQPPTDEVIKGTPKVSSMSSLRKKTRGEQYYHEILYSRTDRQHRCFAGHYTLEIEIDSVELPLKRWRAIGPCVLPVERPSQGRSHFRPGRLGMMIHDTLAMGLH